MKKAIILAGIFTSTGLLFGGTYTTVAPQVSVAQEEIYEIGPPAYINDIKVPYEVLQYVHSNFPAHAVVEARKVKVDNKNGFRLIISRDSKARGKTHIYFTDKWKLVKEEEVFANKQKSVAPQPVKPEVDEPSPQPEPEPDPKPVVRQSPERSRPNPRPAETEPESTTEPEEEQEQESSEPEEAPSSDDAVDTEDE